MSAACQKDTVLPRVSSAVGRPVCVCETYICTRSIERMYTHCVSRLVIGRAITTHPAAKMHCGRIAARGRRARKGKRTGPWRRRRGPSAAGSWSRVGRCAPLPRNGTGSYRISPEIVAKRASGRTRQARMSARRAQELCPPHVVAFYPDSVAQELCPPHVVAFYPDSVASDGVLYRVDRTTTHRSRGAVSRRHRPSLRRGAGPLRRPHFGSFDSLKT